jgi:DNA polymerase-3 subunit alpha
LAREREALGFFITGHPVEAYRALLPRLATTPTDGLDRLKADAEVRVAGMVSALRQIKTKRGDKMAFVTLEDVNGSVECVFFSEPWARSQRALSEDQPVLVTGKLEAATVDNPPKIMGENAELLSEIRERRTRIVDLALEAEDLADERNLGELMKLLGASKGSVPLRVHLRLPDRAWVSLPPAEGLTVLPDENLLQGLETLFRRSDVVRRG